MFLGADEETREYIGDKILSYFLSEIQKKREEFPEITDDMLEPSIYYINGKNGTDFDWKENNHTSYFSIFYKTDTPFLSMAIGVNKNHEGIIHGYVNANGVIMDFSYPITPQPFQYDQLHIFAEYLYAHSDHYENYNASIDDLFPSKSLTLCEEKEEELV